MKDIQYPVTLQQLFDIGWEHFVVNYSPLSMNEDKQCLYRGPNGTKCLIGMILPDDIAKIADGQVVPKLADELSNNYPDIFDNSTSPMLWRKAQGFLHDSLIFTDKDGRESEYRLFAKNHGLKVPESTDM